VVNWTPSQTQVPRRFGNVCTVAGFVFVQNQTHDARPSGGFPPAESFIPIGGLFTICVFESSQDFPPEKTPIICGRTARSTRAAQWEKEKRRGGIAVTDWRESGGRGACARNLVPRGHREGKLWERLIGQGVAVLDGWRNGEGIWVGRVIGRIEVENWKRLGRKVRLPRVRCLFTGGGGPR